jgi:subtilisin family serine protease
LASELYTRRLDTGIDYTHPTLGGKIGAGNKIGGGYDFVGDNYNGEPYSRLADFREA